MFISLTTKGRVNTKLINIGTKYEGHTKLPQWSYQIQIVCDMVAITIVVILCGLHTLEFAV